MPDDNDSQQDAGTTADETNREPEKDVIMVVELTKHTTIRDLERVRKMTRGSDLEADAMWEDQLIFIVAETEQ